MLTPETLTVDFVGNPLSPLSLPLLTPLGRTFTPETVDVEPAVGKLSPQTETADSGDCYC